jgi:hypothetical protein
MFKFVGRLILLVVMVSGWTLALSAVHVIHTPTRIQVITKDRLTFADTFADTRHWTLDDVPNHATLVRRVLALKQEDLLKHVTDPHGWKSVKDQLADAVRREPKQPKQPQSTDVSAGWFDFSLPF